MYYVMCLYYSVPIAGPVSSGFAVEMISRVVVTRHSGRRRTSVNNNNIIVTLLTRHNSNIVSAGEDDTLTTVGITLNRYAYII